MSGSDLYIGIRGPQPKHGHGGPRVVGVRQGSESRPLQPRAGAPPEDPYEWGYAGRGPTELAEAILFDALGFDPPDVVSLAFMNDVVAGLTKGDFELPLAHVQNWIGQRLAETCALRLE